MTPADASSPPELRAPRAASAQGGAGVGGVGASTPPRGADASLPQRPTGGAKPAAAATIFNWPFLGRVVLKAAILFVIFNLLFAATYPLPALGQISFYNLLFPGRQRFPFGENPAQSYNLSLYNLDAMFASLAFSARPKPADEYRVLVVGDSSVWGILLRPEDTLAGKLNALQLSCRGKPLVAYNLGYPTISVTKDLMVLHEALRYQPDQIVWNVTLEGMLRQEQLRSPILANNPQRARALIRQYGLKLDPNDPAFVDPSFWDRTIVGARRPLADLLRLQLYGELWGATGIDQVYDWNPQKDAAQRDFTVDPSFHGSNGPALDPDLLSLDVLGAGIKLAGGVPLTLVNEPILISSGQNSDIRYDFYYPRWAYDAYRVQLAAQASSAGWSYLDLWNRIPEDQFTNSAIHLTPAGEMLLAQAIGGQLCR